MTEKITYKSVFKQKEFLKLMLAGMINRFGDSVDAIASAWIVYELTSNAVWSAIIFGVNKLPTVFVTPLAGPWVEGRNKKSIMVVTDLIRAVCVAFVATGYFMGFLQAWMLLATTFIISTAEAFRGPAGTAITPMLLEEKYYEYGISLSTTVCNIIELIGTALAAGIIAVIGTAGAIYVDMATFLMSAGIIAMIRTKEAKGEKQAYSMSEYLETLKDGIRYVKKNNAVFFFVMLAILLNAMLVPFNSLQAPLANEVIGGGAEILSVLGVGVTCGIAGGSFFYPMIKSKLKKRAVFLLGGVSVGIYYCLLVFCMPFYSVKWFTYGFIAVTSFLFGIFATLLSCMMEIEFVKSLDNRYLARTASILTAASAAAAPAASFLISAIAAVCPTHMIFMIVGVLDIIVCLIMAKHSVLEERQQEEETEEATIADVQNV